MHIVDQRLGPIDTFYKQRKLTAFHSCSLHTMSQDAALACAMI